VAHKQPLAAAHASSAARRKACAPYSARRRKRDAGLEAESPAQGFPMDPPRWCSPSRRPGQQFRRCSDGSAGVMLSRPLLWHRLDRLGPAHPPSRRAPSRKWLWPLCQIPNLFAFGAFFVAAAGCRCPLFDTCLRQIRQTSGSPWHSVDEKKRNREVSNNAIQEYFILQLAASETSQFPVATSCSLVDRKPRDRGDCHQNFLQVK
jgi:hypothetical protein